MKTVCQELLAMSLSEEPNCEIEVGVVSRFETFRIVQNKVIVFIRNEFLVDRRLSGFVLGHSLSQGQWSCVEGRWKDMAAYGLRYSKYTIDQGGLPNPRLQRVSASDHERTQKCSD